LERRRGNASSRSAGDGRYDVALASDEVSMAMHGGFHRWLMEEYPYGCSERLEAESCPESSGLAL
jgi:hypothetical protein